MHEREGVLVVGEGAARFVGCPVRPAGGSVSRQSEGRGGRCCLLMAATDMACGQVGSAAVGLEAIYSARDDERVEP